jgi:adenine-specific DNA-methyltransferase
MQKIEATSPEALSADITAENIAQLKALFPELMTESANGVALNVDVLKQLVGDAAVTDAEEKYGLNWHGKRRARQLALTPSTGTLRPCPEESVDWDTTQNLMIEGDNLEVLKLLQKSYAGTVKLIYIDPPYNTGKDFVYPDNFQDNIKNYLELTGQVEGGKKISSNTDSSGRFHTDWLNMMYPRVRLAKSLLNSTGAIIVSCDDNELSRLLIVMDEIFGEENFIGQIVWQRSKKGDAKLIATVHEYMLCYVKDKAAVLEQGVWRKPKEGADEVLAKYLEFKMSLAGNHEAIRVAMMEWYRELPEGDPRKSHKHYSWSDDRGLYFPDNFAGPDDGRESRPRHDILHPFTQRSCKKPSTGWRWDEEKTNWALAQVPPRIHFGPDETTIPTRKSYLFEIDSEPYSSVFYRDGRSATLEVEDLVGKGWFQFPKNTDVLSELIELITKPSDLVMDFFAGSGSTAHAVMKVNAAHHSNRRFIAVQLPEPTGKELYKTIADITKERLRRAGAKIKKQLTSEHTEDTEKNLSLAFNSVSSVVKEVDLGFRVFKLDTSNIQAWNPDRDNLEKTLLDHEEHILPGRTEADIMYELLLKLGLDLCVPIETKIIDPQMVADKVKTNPQITQMGADKVKNNSQIGADAVENNDLFGFHLRKSASSADKNGFEVHAIGGGVLMACLAERIAAAEVEALAQGIVAWHKELAPAGDTTCVFRDSAFENDIAKSNLAAILEQYGIHNVRSL